MIIPWQRAKRGACLRSLKGVTGVKRSVQTKVKIDLVHKTARRQKAVGKLPPAFIGLPFPVVGGPADVKRIKYTQSH